MSNRKVSEHLGLCSVHVQPTLFQFIVFGLGASDFDLYCQSCRFLEDLRTQKLKSKLLHICTLETVVFNATGRFHTLIRKRQGRHIPSVGMNSDNLYRETFSSLVLPPFSCMTFDVRTHIRASLAGSAMNLTKTIGQSSVKSLLAQPSPTSSLMPGAPGSIIKLTEVSISHKGLPTWG